jgi:uncharacterized protein (DUF2236 family)
MGEQVCFNTPIPYLPPQARKLMNVVMRGMLPEEVRDMYGVSNNPVETGIFHVATTAMRLGGKLLPGAIKSGDNTIFFKQVAREEARLHATGRQVMMPENPY